uniref:Secreted protein n=1 Tax=Rousettus aegyptiacus TaxID=9407 RepID=A0A7J8D680_ROUAE|nr:hypothetical protein HJG63_008786 [Rousettus aegyptiacus]
MLVVRLLVCLSSVLTPRVFKVSGHSRRHEVPDYGHRCVKSRRGKRVKKRKRKNQDASHPFELTGAPFHALVQKKRKRKRKEKRGFAESSEVRLLHGPGTGILSDVRLKRKNIPTHSLPCWFFFNF